MKISPLCSWAAALLVAATPALAAAAPDLDQGWGPQQEATWYELSQGSRMLPLSWIKALEQPDSTAPFLADAFMEGKHRFPMRNLTTVNLRSPRGFAVDQQVDLLFGDTKLRWKQLQSPAEPWWGPTCGACHASQISYGGTSFAVPGGQTMGDFQTLLEDLNKALDQTYRQPAKFARFAQGVLGFENNLVNRLMLKDALGQLRYESDNHLYQEQEQIDTLRYGPGRLDAIGHIYDKVSRMNDAAQPTLRPSDAPTSYPFLWNVPQLDRVQWTGFAPNAKVFGFDAGALVRNTGEVVGVFADVQTRPGGMGYVSSVQVRNLEKLEETLGDLRPPAWPAQLLGALDAGKVAQGRQLFADKGCASCHAPLDRNDLFTPVKTDLTRLAPQGGGEPLGTDPWTACNGYQASSASGNFLFMPTVPGFTVAGLGLMGPEAYLLDMTAWLQIGILLQQAPQTAATAAEALLLGSWFNGQFIPVSVAIAAAQGLLSPQPLVKKYSEDRQVRKAQCLAIDHPLIAYKARPLTGIWASAPYLHNGSVPTLYDLLLPPEQRPQVFYTGSREFDPQRVGYVTTQGQAGNYFMLDTQLEGNSNAGHVYGVRNLNHAQRDALVEYMKSL